MHVQSWCSHGKKEAETGESPEAGQPANLTGATANYNQRPCSNKVEGVDNHLRLPFDLHIHAVVPVHLHANASYYT